VVSIEPRIFFDLREMKMAIFNGGVASPQLTTEQETVYIVEDDSSTRDALGELIRPTGANVQLFDSAEAFLNGFDRNTPSCLLLDESLPGINGCDLLRQIRSEGVPIPAIFVTGYATVPMTVNAMRMGAMDVLEKPCCENELRVAIKDALAHDRKQLRRSANRRQAAERIEQLTPSERSVLTQVLEGVPNKQIASQLGVCIRTVEARRSRIYKTMGVNSVAELARVCVAAGFVDA